MLKRNRAIYGAALLLFCPALWAQTEIERRVDASPDGLVSIDNIAGSVRVRGWDGAQVEVTGTVQRGVDDVRIESRGRRTEIKVVLEDAGHRSWSAEAHLEIRVPRGSRVEVEVVSAEVTVEEVAGEISVESVSGSVEVQGRPAEVEVDAVSGGVRIEADSPRVSAQTVSGAVRLEGAIRDVEADSVSGSIDVRAGDLRRADLETTSGSIELSGDLADRAVVGIKSFSGPVELVLSTPVSARFEVETHSGRIENELGPPAERVSRYGPGKELRFTAGNGDARIEIESFSGRVRLRGR